METITISPNRHIKLRHSVPSSRLIKFEIEADHPVKSYVLGPKSYERFSQGSKSFRYYGGFPDPRANQRQEVRIPFSGSWYLVIINPDKNEPVEVRYAVYY